MNKNILTYEKSGVNIKGVDKFVKFTSSKAKKQKNSIIQVYLAQLEFGGYLDILDIIKYLL